jgi:FixJ family two-component response regulator
MISDIVMPGMRGKVLAQRLAPLRPEMKVLFMSGYADHAVMPEGGVEAGHTFLEKPFTPDSLTRKVRLVLDPVDVLPAA